MRVSGEPQNQLTAAWRTFHSRPPGAEPPVGVLGDFEPARKTLKAFDPALEIWWSPWRDYGTDTPGRWRIMQWGPRAQNWIHILYWQYDDGSYRPLYPIGALIRKLDSMRAPLAQVSEEADVANEIAKMEHKREMVRIQRDHWQATRKRGGGTQRVFGGGVIRKRSDIISPSIDPAYVAEMRRMGIRRYG